MPLLAYMAQEAVRDAYDWMTAPEMVDGLGLAETTPGPLILVTQFVGFLAAFRDARAVFADCCRHARRGDDHWVTFVPSMLWIFAGAPFVEQLRANRRLVGRARRDHRGGGRRHPQSLGLVRAACAVRPGRGAAPRRAALVSRSIRWRSTSRLRRWPRSRPCWPFALHRGLIEVVAVMAALGIAVQLGPRLISFRARSRFRASGAASDARTATARRRSRCRRPTAAAARRTCAGC